MDDWDLLEQFRLTRSEQAFADLVRRHAGFVLATCRRRLRGDAHGAADAEDAAQAVFLVLAKRPPVQSAANASLAGWLYKTAVYACNNAMRAKRSRDLHERAAAVDPQATTESPRLDHAVNEALLDDALASLSSKERDAVLLRYYQDQSVQQVGTTLGISANSATKRIGRAIERMREYLAGKGLAIATPALIDAVTSATRAPAPPEFVAQTIAIAGGQSAASIAVQTLAQGVNSMIRIAQMKLVASVIAAVVMAGGGIVAVSQLMAQSQPPNATAKAQPATQLARRIKAESPKAALIAFGVAMRGADVEAMKQLVDIKDPAEEQLLLAACDYSGAQHAFTQAVKEKFGDQAVAQLKQGMQLSIFDGFIKSIETQLDQLTETIDGDHAVLTAEGAPNDDIHLVRTDAEGWRISATGMTKKWTPEQHAEVLTHLQRGAQGLGELTEEINDGKIDTFDDLIQTLRGMFQRGR